MAWNKLQIESDIKTFLERLRKLGLEVNIKETKRYKEIRIYYTNIEYQKSLIDELIREHKIKKKYLKYISNLWSDYIKIRVLEGFYYNTLKELITLRNILKEIYENYNESKYLDLLRQEIYNKFNRFMDDYKHIIENEKILKELENKYIEFLNKKLEYSDEIKNFEEWLNSIQQKDKYKVVKYIKEKIKALGFNKFKILKIENGRVFILTYENRYFRHGWNYENNRFYIIDLRENNIIDVSDKIGDAYKELVDYDKVYDFSNIDMNKLLQK
ncbi:MAG: hypothetical protein ACP5G1_03680 [Nanopusillaceae archaeon]